MSKKSGALPHQTICEMIECGAIKDAPLSLVNPASLDLTITDEVYRVRSVFLPRCGESVAESMSHVCPERHNLSVPLEVGVTYLARLHQTLALPGSIYGYGNPKSTSGRNDIHTRLLADGITRFDSIGVKGFGGSLWLLITPRSFRPKLSEGDALLQTRFFNEDTRFTADYELEIAYKRYQFLFTPEGEPIHFTQAQTTDNDGAIILSVNLDADIVGYRCERSQEVLDWAKIGFHDPDDFFTPIYRPKNGSLVLRRGDFYILFTREFIKVPPQFAVEMVPVDIRSGDYRAQYAGYFDPGWGHGPDGSLKGAPAVMEVRSFEDNIIIRHGQPICKMTFERMAEIPDVVYGKGSNYLLQRGPKLSKHFKEK